MAAGQEFGLPARPGSIIPLHPMYDEKSNTIRSIPLVIRGGLKGNGYSFQTIDELLEWNQ